MFVYFDMYVYVSLYINVQYGKYVYLFKNAWRTFSQEKRSMLFSLSVRNTY